MFTLPPPRVPQVPPTPCPTCRSEYAVQMYATSRVEYYRCVTCGGVWASPHDEHPEHHNLEAA